MAKKKIETAEQTAEVAQEAPKKRSTKKVKAELSAEQGVVILACINENFLEKLNKLAEKEGIKVVLTNEQVIYDYVAQQNGGVDETARMTAFLKDERNRKFAYEHASELYRILTGQRNHVSYKYADTFEFSKAQLVKQTTLSWKKAEEMLNTLQVFGFVKRLEKKDEFKFHFEPKDICEQILKDVSFSVEGLNFEIQRYKGAVENAGYEDAEKEKVLEKFKKELEKNVVF